MALQKIIVLATISALLLTTYCAELSDSDDGLNFVKTDFSCKESYFHENDSQALRSFSMLKNCSKLIEKQPLEITQDGYLHYNGKFMSPRDYCVAQDEHKSATLCLHHSPIIWRKCCPENKVTDLTNPNACVNSTHPFRPGGSGPLQSFEVIPTTLVGFTCPNGFYLQKFSTTTCATRSMTRFRLFSNGSIAYQAATGVYLRTSQWKMLSYADDHYCIDGVINVASDCSLQEEPDEINTSPRNSGCTNDGDDWHQMASVLYICVQQEHPEEANHKGSLMTKTTLLAVVWSLTCPLLLGAALGNSCVIQKNVHGWILTCYLLSMLVLNILSIFTIQHPVPTHDSCRFVDVFIKFMYMSTLCWMTSINFGLCKTFRFAKHGYTLPQPVGLRRFIWSTIFSLGFPVISLVATYYRAYAGTDANCRSEHCLLFSKITIPVYTIPIFLMVLGNFAIFLKTLYTIGTLRKETKDILREQAPDHLKSFTLFAKLFLLTGSIWLVRLALFVLQLKGLYMTWYGVMLEVTFSIPEVVFPLIIFHHPEFIKWSWSKAPCVSRLIFVFDPFFRIAASGTK